MKAAQLLWVRAAIRKRSFCGRHRSVPPVPTHGIAVGPVHETACGAPAGVLGDDLWGRHSGLVPGGSEEASWLKIGAASAVFGRCCSFRVDKEAAKRRTYGSHGRAGLRASG